MTLDQFSTLLAIGSMALFASCICAGAGAIFSRSARAWLMKWDYGLFLTALGVVAGASVFGTLIFQLAYLTPVCELCWWQRIFLYPIPLIAGIAYWYKTKEAHVTIGILSALGLWYASNHYYYHFQKFVLGNEFALPCSFGGLMPACTDSPILIFGFITIPFFGIMVFGSMLIISVFSQFRTSV